MRAQLLSPDQLLFREARYLFIMSFFLVFFVHIAVHLEAYTVNFFFLRQ